MQEQSELGCTVIWQCYGIGIIDLLNMQIFTFLITGTFRLEQNGQRKFCVNFSEVQ